MQRDTVASLRGGPLSFFRPGGRALTRGSLKRIFGGADAPGIRAAPEQDHLHRPADLYIRGHRSPTCTFADAFPRKPLPRLQLRRLPPCLLYIRGRSLITCTFADARDSGHLYIRGRRPVHSRTLSPGNPCRPAYNSEGFPPLDPPSGSGSRQHGPGPCRLPYLTSDQTPKAGGGPRNPQPRRCSRAAENRIQRLANDGPRGESALTEQQRQ